MGLRNSQENPTSRSRVLPSPSGGFRDTASTMEQPEHTLAAQPPESTWSASNPLQMSASREIDGISPGSQYVGAALALAQYVVSVGYWRGRINDEQIVNIALETATTLIECGFGEQQAPQPCSTRSDNMKKYSDPLALLPLLYRCLADAIGSIREPKSYSHMSYQSTQIECEQLALEKHLARLALGKTIDSYNRK
ncbi:hypothetical protein ASPFODRAFT_31835 [Aspergillus luchuensis CBS 106.47]|uniref:Uncharacterized protein n=1 Tax=Aspergillus luchuensis (strain CBS 106.47) TaxID=1137211 RepID=A0A1M3TK02_ASPLC|nr:hypothetical protein ASPFODRAFT_31835 [Aspergillus luchuensis CBS 106.47]